MLNIKKVFEKKKEDRKIIYGVTDRSKDPIFTKIDDFLIDNSSVDIKEKGLFFHSLQILVKSGVRFIRSLEILGDRTKNKRFKRIINTVIYDMENNGSSFSISMAKFPTAFTNSEIKMIYSGEIAGKLEETLESIATQLQKNLELEIQVKSALMYPVTVVGAIILAGTIVMLFVVPKFTLLFSEFESELPFATRFLMGSSSFFQQYWWFVLTLLIAARFLFKNWVNTPKGARTWDNFLLNAPLFSPLVNNIQTVRIANNFSTLMKSGVPIVKTIHILGEIMPNTIIKDAVFKVEADIRSGVEVHKSFAEQEVFDSIFGEVIEIGEESGRLPEMLGRTGEQYELEVDAQLRNLTTMIEPIVIFLVGGAVIFMAMAIMTPIFKLQELFMAS
ncbi:MAG: type II secretion system F family protein [Candidatus Peregrinibacteria bacterium]|nr:type II secretion system F family protein [Candidatus Peregrinibacteria bacterium]